MEVVFKIFKIVFISTWVDLPLCFGECQKLSASDQSRPVSVSITTNFLSLEESRSWQPWFCWVSKSISLNNHKIARLGKFWLVSSIIVSTTFSWVSVSKFMVSVSTSRPCQWKSRSQSRLWYQYRKSLGLSLETPNLVSLIPESNQWLLWN